MRVNLSSYSELEEKLEEIGFTHRTESGNHNFYWGSSSGKLQVEKTYSSNYVTNINYVDSQGTTYTLRGTSSTGGYVDAYILEYFPLANNGIILRLIPSTSTGQAFPFGLQLAFLVTPSEGVIQVFREDGSSSAPKIDDGLTVTQVRLINYTNMTGDTTANVVQIGRLYNQDGSFLDVEVYNCLMCPSTMSQTSIYTFTIGDDTYIAGMSSSTTSSGSAAFGNRLVFKM